MKTEFGLYHYDAELGKNVGYAEGMFIAPIGLPESMIGREVMLENRQLDWYATDTLYEYSFTLLSSNQAWLLATVEELKLHSSQKWPGVYSIFGQNPFDYLEPEEE